ncbi:ABC transporter ATP-binding protein [Paenibacillus sp. NFR01]|uniref:ABC transporter ATP-binding protein n=1 Tax=Paenibacillus sp. NFR01 TaxID=1566279 RepID=UPI0008AC448F|nr:ABC transporter ATP-binding protein [Paenibacillus sp. NFR01]SET45410.1 ABC-2 type transport system ATP-binding protein [Paenibacillus sp. NFR01]
MNTVAAFTEVSKSFGSFTAVDRVSFALEENKIYGLLGRNGAGKTTIMHLLTAQQFATGGDIRVFGEAPYENSKVLQQLCFIKESQRFPDHFSVRDVLKLAPSFYPHWDAAFADSLVSEFNLPLKRRMKKLSRGMLSAVCIIIGLASRAPLTLFDEPYLGLDAVARQLFYTRLLEDYSLNPRTIVLSTHLIDEVSQLLEHVIVIDKGRVILDEESEELRGAAFTVTGPADKIERLASGKRVLRRESFAGQSSATLMGGWTQREREAASGEGLTLTPVSLQQLVVGLTGADTAIKTGVGL